MTKIRLFIENGQAGVTFADYNPPYGFAYLHHEGWASMLPSDLLSRFSVQFDGKNATITYTGYNGMVHTFRLNAQNGEASFGDKLTLLDNSVERYIRFHLSLVKE